MRAFIGLGSNLGNREENIRGALSRLEGAGVKVVRVSSLLENAAVGGPEGSPEFLNGVAEVETNLAARELLEVMLNVEGKMGRVRTVKWGPRVIDLDLLLYGGEVIDEPGLKVPHPHMQERAFVMGPLAQIAPGVEHPVLGKKVEEIWADSKAGKAAK